MVVATQQKIKIFFLLDLILVQNMKLLQELMNRRGSCHHLTERWIYNPFDLLVSFAF